MSDLRWFEDCQRIVLYIENPYDDDDEPGPI